MTETTPPSACSALFAQASERFHQGAVREAETLCRQVLRAEPHHFASLNLLGVITAQQRRFAEAESLMRSAISIDARNPDLFINLGYVLREQGRQTAALECYDRALALDQSTPMAWYNRGLALYDLGRFEDAAGSFERVLHFWPGYLAAWNNLGASLKELKRYGEALSCHERVLSINREDAFAWNNRVVVLNCLGDHDEALTSCRMVLSLEPRLVQGWINMAHTCNCLGCYDEALQHAEQSLRLAPGCIDGLINKGAALVGLMRGEDAARCYEQALVLFPGRADVFNGLSLAFLCMNRIEEGLAFSEQAIAVKPDHSDFQNNRGMFLNLLHHYDEARSCYLKATELDPTLPDPHLNMGLLQLSLGEFAEGWQNYEWRWKTEWVRRYLRTFDKPLWLGQEPLEGRTILLHSEQGLGDTILACRYLPMVVDLGARVILEVEQPFISLFSQFDKIEAIIPKGDALPSFDFHCPLMSLPLAFGTTVDTIPSPDGYLVADRKKVTSWSRKLGKKKRPRIGLVWSGSRSNPNLSHRRIPLEELLSHLPEGFDYVSLQKEVWPEDEEILRSREDIRHFGDALEDFSDTAAMCKLVDAVVGVDTALSNLAGALGRPVLLLLSFNPDWRWMLDRSDNPWYRSVRLFRQQVRGAWPEVVEEVAAALSAKFLK
jgi:tetratricopeptide (TPR) repeat protein